MGLDYSYLRDWRVGDVILDTYEVRHIFTSGGMGLVYRVHHRGWGIDLALKSPRPEIFTRPGGKENFVREAETWVDLGLHPHIVSCYYVRSIDEIPGVFAEYVEGGSLKDWIEDRRLYEGGQEAALERILDGAIQFAWGLAYAHERGLVHQDVKPANVLMTLDGVAKVTDFGLAKARAEAGERVGLAGGGNLLVSSGGMTPAYCSPEQARGEMLSTKTDIWSWGVSTLEMFTGEATWMSGVAAGEVLENYLEMGGNRVGIPPMPASLAELLRECFQMSPNQRPADMLIIAGRLQEIYLRETSLLYTRQAPKAADLRAASLNNKALSLLDLGQPEKAESAWVAALEADPLHTESTYNQGLVLWRCGKLTDEDLLIKLHSAGVTNPGSSEYLYQSALVHLERGDGFSAKETLISIQGPVANREDVKAALSLVNNPEFKAKFILQTPFLCTTHVTAVCLSADGHFAITGDDEKTVRLWDSTSGYCLRTFDGHTNCVKSVYLSADGRYALSGSDDHTLKLWELGSGKCLRTFKGHKDRVTSGCLSVDGHYAVAGSWNNTLKLWDVQSGGCLRTFEGHEWVVESVCLSSDGRFALSGSWDKKLILWEVESGRRLRTFKGHTDIVKTVTLSADGRYALSGSNDKTLRLWEVESERCLHTFEGHKFFVNSACLSADGRYALSISSDKTIRLWEAESGRCLRTVDLETFDTQAVSLSADGRFALSGGSKAVNLWKVQLGESTPTAPFIFSHVNTVHEALTNQASYEQALTQAQRAMEKGDAVQAARHIRVARSQPSFERASGALDTWRQLFVHLPRKSFSGAWNIGILEGHSDQVNSVCLSADRRFALSGSRDKTLKLWEIPGGYCLHTFKGHSDYVNSVCMSADGGQALSGSYDKTLKLWETSSGRPVSTFEGHSSWVNAVCLSVDGRFAVSGSSDKSIKLWDVASGRQLRTFKPNTDAVKSVCLSADGCHILADNGYETLKLWKISNGRCIRTLKGIWLECSTSLSMDGRYAMSASGSAKLWEIATGKCLRTFDDRGEYLSAVSISADGRYAFTGSRNGTLRLWEVPSGRCLHTFEGHMDRVNSVSLSADGRYALSGSADNTIKLWALDWELEDMELANWDAGASAYLEIFLAQQTPYAVQLPKDGQPREEDITLALTRRGKPTWIEEDFHKLLYTLGCAGYGWLRPEGVRKKLEEMAAERGRNA